MKLLIRNATIINEGLKFKGSLLINDDKIDRIYPYNAAPSGLNLNELKIMDASDLWLMPGVIDDQVHFREPGLTHKGDIYSESRAAVAGGVTSFMEMPNTIPQAVTNELLDEKYDIAALRSAANYSFYLGATNSNLNEILRVNPSKVCGIKIFMGSSTGNMLVDDEQVLYEIFKNAPALIAVHCEDEKTIRKNLLLATEKYGDNIPIAQHAHIRSEEACFLSSSKAVDLASKLSSRLHLLHLSTAKEMELLSSGKVEEKSITAEVCVHHLWFDETDYNRLGNRIKWNPAIKTVKDKEALWEALLSDKIDVVATDHAPHTIEEKSGSYINSPSGGPLVQHSLVAMLEMSRKGVIPPEKVVQKMCHAPAELFRVDRRGYIREGYFADLVLVDPNKSQLVESDNILYKCGWSPFEGVEFSHSVVATFVNGKAVWQNGEFAFENSAQRLLFNNPD